ncbi:MAG TPA: hypothetical protein DDY51_13210 [Erwinia persicina]|nr:hypothetical protein [Erwinia persicina]
MQKLKRLFRNIKFLMRHDLREIKNRDSISHEQLNVILDNLLSHELPDNPLKTKKPNIKNIEETIEHLISKKSSFARFGDGELELMNGKNIPFQSANPALSEKLKRTIESSEEGLMVGINYHYYHAELSGLLPVVKKFYRASVPHFRKTLDLYIDSEKQYYSAAMTQVYSFFESYAFEKHFERIKTIWKERNITIICGKTVFNEIENNIFDCASSIDYIHAPSLNAFDNYDEILNQASHVEKNNLIILILGPTAKPLVYDLHMLGYQALDLGHIAKDYDAYVKGQTRDEKYIVKFFSPD